MSNIDIKEIFKNYKDIINKYLHTEYMLYYDLKNGNKPMPQKIYFGSYKEMCSDCQELWAKDITFQQGQYNVICFFKKEDTERKEFIEGQINQSCLQFYK